MGRFQHLLAHDAPEAERYDGASAPHWADAAPATKSHRRRRDQEFGKQTHKAQRLPRETRPGGLCAGCPRRGNRGE